MLLLQTALSPDPTMVNDLLSTVTASTLAVSIIQWLKSTKLVPFINQHSAGLNRTLSWFIAFASGAGIHYTFNGDAGVLTITGLSAGVIIHTATITCKQYAIQWLIYRGIVSKQAGDVTAVAEGVPASIVVSPGTAKAGLDASKKAEG